jgi:hypothetical protein
MHFEIAFNLKPLSYLKASHRYTGMLLGWPPVKCVARKSKMAKKIVRDYPMTLHIQFGFDHGKVI